MEARDPPIRADAAPAARRRPRGAPGLPAISGPSAAGRHHPSLAPTGRRARVQSTGSPVQSIAAINGVWGEPRPGRRPWGGAQLEAARLGPSERTFGADGTAPMMEPPHGLALPGVALLFGPRVPDQEVEQSLFGASLLSWAHG